MSGPDDSGQTIDPAPARQIPREAQERPRDIAYPPGTDSKVAARCIRPDQRGRRISEIPNTFVEETKKWGLRSCMRQKSRYA